LVGILLQIFLNKLTTLPASEMSFPNLVFNLNLGFAFFKGMRILEVNMTWNFGVSQFLLKKIQFFNAKIILNAS
jgi:hypothetical protein